VLKKLLDGALFGTGFAIAFMAIWLVATVFIVPWAFESRYPAQETKEPEFRQPRQAQVAAPKPGPAVENKEFSFFKHSKDRMKIPEGGGIISMSPMTTAKGASRPSTYQLWLTESKLWQIRTAEEKAEIEELAYPEGNGVEHLDKLMHKNLGFAARQSTMTVSSYDVDALKRTGQTSRDETLNGKMKISVEGVVFIVPNPY
jgi:hypothetical protein